MDKNKTLRLWETAALIALCFCLCAGTWARARSTRLASSLIRLRVVADSDAEYEQELKLRVRDSVLGYLSPLLADAASAPQARELISGCTDGIREAALASAEGREISVALTREYFPTRDYGSFALPAGEYETLKVTIGSGTGRNWWCVAFPPLCLEAAEAQTAMTLLPESDRTLITGEDGVILKFRIIELWGELREKLG